MSFKLELNNDTLKTHIEDQSAPMFNLASSLLYNSLFQQNNNGEFEHKGNSAIKPPTYTLGLKAIPDDVVWALSAINLDQYELPEWRSGLNNIFS